MALMRSNREGIENNPHQVKRKRNANLQSPPQVFCSHCSRSDYGLQLVVFHATPTGLGSSALAEIEESDTFRLSTVDGNECYVT